MSRTFALVKGAVHAYTCFTSTPGIIESSMETLSYFLLLPEVSSIIISVVEVVTKMTRQISHIDQNNRALSFAYVTMYRLNYKKNHYLILPLCLRKKFTIPPRIR